MNSLMSLVFRTALVPLPYRTITTQLGDRNHDNAHATHCEISPWDMGIYLILADVVSIVLFNNLSNSTCPNEQ